MRKFLFLIGAAAIFGVGLVSAAQAAPVTSADFAGKKICWGGGSISSYGAGGKYSNNLTGEGTWSMTAGGMHVHTDRYDYIAKVEKLPGGTFHAVILGTEIKTDGKYCN
jgi:hypothetical protein